LRIAAATRDIASPITRLTSSVASSGKPASAKARARREASRSSSVNTFGVGVGHPRQAERLALAAHRLLVLPRRLGDVARRVLPLARQHHLHG